MRTLLVSMFLIMSFFSAGCSDGDNQSFPSSWADGEIVPSSDRVKVLIASPLGYVGRACPIAVRAVSSSGSPLPEAKGVIASENEGSFGDDGAKASFETDTRGFANVVFIPSKTGTNIIRASVGDHFGIASIQVGALPAEGTVVGVIPSATSVETDKKLIIQVCGYSESNTPLEKASVALSASIGELESSTGEISNGWFTTIYTAPSEVGVATITAMINGKSSSCTLSVQ